MIMVADFPSCTGLHFGTSPQLIANEVKRSRYFVRNVLRYYDLNNSSSWSMPKMREAQPRSRLKVACVAGGIVGARNN